MTDKPVLFLFALNSVDPEALSVWIQGSLAHKYETNKLFTLYFGARRKQNLQSIPYIH